MGYWEALTERNEKEQRRRVLLATVLTWSGEQLRASLKMAENLTLAKLSVIGGRVDGWICENERVETLGQLRTSFIPWTSSLAHQILGQPLLLRVIK